MEKLKIFSRIMEALSFGLLCYLLELKGIEILVALILILAIIEMEVYYRK